MNDIWKTNPFAIQWTKKLEKRHPELKTRNGIKIKVKCICCDCNLDKDKKVDIDESEDCDHECISNCRREGCNCACGNVHISCKICQDTGEVDCMEAVYPGEPHMAMVGTRKCECRLSDNDE